jgi:hypothetical protein
VIHSALFRRPSQSIGVNWVHACAQPSFDRDKFMGAEIQSAAKAALLLLDSQDEEPQGPAATWACSTATDRHGQFGNEEMKLGNSPVALKIHTDDDVEIIEGNRGRRLGRQASSTLLDHDTAGATGLSYYTLTGQYGQTSFTSVRAAKLAEDAHFRPLQNWFAGHVALPSAANSTARRSASVC